MSGSIKPDKGVYILERTLDWKQGLAIALGVPLLILPSIGYFTSYVWGFSIIIWILSITQGFIQNFAYGELASRYPEASGLPGFVQVIFKGNTDNEYCASKFIGGFSAWGYWFAWNPVLAIYSILIGTYLHGLIPAFNNVPVYFLSLASGIVIFGFLILINWKGVAGGAKLGYILAVFSITPLMFISISTFFTGSFHVGNITNYMLPLDWQWDSAHIIILLGLMAMAQWSACAWETAAIYAPEYKNPKKDIPKALFVCGIFCIFTFVVVQMACVGTLGVEAIIAEPYSPMLGLAQISLGDIGVLIAIPMLLASMVLIIQTGLLGSSKAMQSMAQEGNLPQILGKSNIHNVPIVAMIIISLFNLVLIGLGNPSTILAASALGYSVANGISLFAYFKASKTAPQVKDDEYFKAPKGWKYLALACGILNIPLYFIGITMINILDFGLQSALIGLIVLLLYVPLWYYSKCEARDRRIMDHQKNLGGSN